MNHFAPHPHFFRLPQIDEAVFLLKGDRTDGAECSYAAPAPFKFRCVCPALEENKNYRWYFNIYCETKKTIPSLRVEGVVRRVKLNQELTQKINLAKPIEKVELYAAEGIWFNSINTLAQLRQQEPENQQLIETWQNLVESIGMEDIANKPLISNNISE